MHVHLRLARLPSCSAPFADWDRSYLGYLCIRQTTQKEQYYIRTECEKRQKSEEQDEKVHTISKREREAKVKIKGSSPFPETEGAREGFFRIFKKVHHGVIHAECYVVRRTSQPDEPHIITNLF